MREMRPEPAVEPLAALVRADGEGLDAGHAKAPRAIQSPAKSPRMERPTDSPT
jgi:hypothetical protein